MLYLNKKRTQVGPVTTPWAPLIEDHQDVFYISPSGIDGIGRGSRELPLKTASYAIQAAPKTAPGTPIGIVFLSGTHQIITNDAIGMGSGGNLRDFGQNVHFYADSTADLCVIESSSLTTTRREVHSLHMTNSNSKAYGLVFVIKPSASQDLNYECAFFGKQGSSAGMKGTVYNCVFTGASKMSLWYTDVPTGNASLVNCSLIPMPGGTPLDTLNSAGLTMTNCFGHSSLLANSTGGVVTSNTSTLVEKFDQGVGTDQGTGVYGGAYAWSR